MSDRWEVGAKAIVDSRWNGMELVTIEKVGKRHVVAGGRKFRVESGREAGSGSGLLHIPTVTKSDASWAGKVSARAAMNAVNNHAVSLRNWLKLRGVETPNLAWLEWLMGYPITWTLTEHSETQ